MQLIEFVLHLEEHLRTFIQEHGLWIYALLFLIIFCETGLVVTPFLPGDSLLFAVGALAAQDILDIGGIYLLLLAAGILGNMVNYAAGYWVGPRVFRVQHSRWFNREYLDRAHGFFEKYGGNALVLARFVPIIRTFVPFVAGIARMDYRRFLLFNVLGTIGWISLFLLGGYFLGNIPVIKQNFKYLILGIIVVSLLPIAIEWWRARKLPKTN